jgi:hypothetical protein
MTAGIVQVIRAPLWRFCRPSFNFSLPPAFSFLALFLFRAHRPCPRAGTERRRRSNIPIQKVAVQKVTVWFMGRGRAVAGKPKNLFEGASL